MKCLRSDSRLEQILFEKSKERHEIRQEGEPGKGQNYLNQSRICYGKENTNKTEQQRQNILAVTNTVRVYKIEWNCSIPGGWL